MLLEMWSTMKGPDGLSCVTDALLEEQMETICQDLENGIGNEDVDHNGVSPVVEELADLNMKHDPINDSMLHELSDVNDKVGKLSLKLDHLSDRFWLS